jgi:single-strand DNA-binding protein
MIKLQIIGNLGKDCIVKEVNGKNVINFSVAHSEKFKDSQGVDKENTTWVECAYWTDKTNVSQYLTKGRTVYAEGYPQIDAYTKEGQPKGTLRMKVITIQLLSGNNSGGDGGPTQHQESLSSQGNSTDKNSGSPLSSTVSDSNQSYESTTSSDTNDISSEKNSNVQLNPSESEVYQSYVEVGAGKSGDDLPF